ncbi:myotubularin-related protein 14-like isoform X1 [Haliotis rufescens]|uniref:myotubularin-related protein 14-like isoform X1 n=1 Tax=Haliotis rufescens TaxID=6454 RepID=UPI001EB053FE|nr:myotubularin-related protein 14-like isoform X1 [Haliotis rufescens]
MMNESSDGGAIGQEDVHRLLEHFSKTTHKVRAGDMKGDNVNETCLLLFAKDYRYSIIPNFSGELCAHYPGKIILTEYEYQKDCPAPHDDSVESIFDLSKLKDLSKQARFARCRSRFVVPVILFEGKHICRSATLSSGAEMYGRSGFDFFFSGGESFPGTNGEEPDDQGSGQLFDRFRGQDKKLLKCLDVGYICDLMVEKKKVKFGMNITSSEKVDKENRYADFCILSVPYPGCEFFKEWKEKSSAGQTIWYDWSQGFNDAALDIPSTPLLSQLPFDWSKYRHWDLVQLTQNYLKLLLHIIREGDSGLLVHCISGWDRTPLFVSLLRLSLWADGSIHKSLSPVEILYLTLGYDWYLFGHNLSDRLSKGEEILFFCFNFLHYITSEEFSVKTKRGSQRRHSGYAGEGRRACRVDSESIIPPGGVLLGPEPSRPSPRGSNTSMSSVGSSETGPVFFTVGSQDDEAVVLHDHSMFSVASLSKHSPSSKSSLSSDSSHSRSSPLQTTSSPMAVPCRRRLADGARSNSPGLGSWQIISSTGSLRGCHDSPHVSSGGGKSSSSSSHISFSSCHEATEGAEQTLRWQRLDSVWRMFHNAYSNSVYVRPGAEAGSGAISSLLEKVGIKSSGKSNSVI